MTLYKGSQKIKSIYKGGTAVSKLYKGSQKIYESSINLPVWKTTASIQTGSFLGFVGANIANASLVPASANNDLSYLTMTITSVSGVIGTSGSTIGVKFSFVDTATYNNTFTSTEGYVFYVYRSSFFDYYVSPFKANVGDSVLVNEPRASATSNASKTITFNISNRSYTGTAVTIVTHFPYS